MSERRILESWKAIAAYLGRTEKTCRTWEHELGLPVHRLDDSAKAHVFAYVDELDRWREEQVESQEDKKNGGQSGLKGLSHRARMALAAGAAVILIGVSAVIVWRLSRESPPPAGPRAVRKVAVLPFSDLSPKKEYEYLCDGMAETLIDSLNKVEGLRVPARASAFYFKGKDAPPQEIGKRLNVDYVLTASVQADGEKLRVIPSLLSVADGYQLWSDKFDRSRSDIFAVEDEIARGIAGALEVKVLGAPGTTIVRPGTRNPEAYSLYMTAQYYIRKGWFSYRQGIDFFEKALEKDPNYAEAFAGIAHAYYTMCRVGVIGPYEGPPEAYPKAKAAALKALEIDSRNSLALGTLSSIKLTYDWDFQGTEDFIKKAIQDNPGSYSLHGCYADLLIALRRFKEAKEEIELALRQDPLSLDLDLIISSAFQYYFLREYDLALELLKRAILLDTHNAGAYVVLVHIYVAMGRYEDARAANQRRREIRGTISRPDDTEALNAIVYALDGNQARAREIAANLDARNRRDPYHPYHLTAWVYAALGDKDKAFYWLERAYQVRTGLLYNLNVYPLADPLRDDPRFKDLIRRIGLER